MNLQEEIARLKWQFEKLQAEIEKPLATYADIHVHDGVTAQSIPSGATYTKITAFTDNGNSANITPDAANDKITITATGIYQVTTSVSFSAGTGNTNWFATLFLAGVEQDFIHFQRKIGTSGDVGSAPLAGMLSVTSVPADLDLRMRHDNPSSVNVTITYANLAIHKVS